MNYNAYRTTTYPNLKEMFCAAYLDACAEIFRDLEELGKEFIGYSSRNLAAMHESQCIVIHPTLDYFGVGPNPLFKDSREQAFFLPLKKFLQPVSLLPQRFLSDSFSPEWTQLFTMVKDTYKTNEPIFISDYDPHYRHKITELQAKGVIADRELIPFTWKTNGSKKDNPSASSLWTKKISTENNPRARVSRIPDSTRDKESMVRKKYYDEFFPATIVPSELIKLTPLHNIKQTVNSFARSFT